MKKITLVLLFCFCAVGFSQTQLGIKASNPTVSNDTQSRATPNSKKGVAFNAARIVGAVRSNYGFSLDNSGLIGPNNWNEVAGTATRLSTPNNSNRNQIPVTITHSTSQTIGTNAVACGAAGLNAENHYYRDFDLANDFGIAGDFNVTAAEFAVQDATDPVVVTVNIWSSTGAAFPGGTLVLEGTATYNSTPADQGTVVSVPVTATIPAGAVMVYEVWQADGSIWRIGSNDLGQTGVTWLSAVDCGLTDPTDAAAIGFPDFHVIMNVVGEEAGGGGGCPIASDCNLTDTTPDDATSPNVWDRPIGAGPGISGLGPVSYDVYGPFTVDTAGDYTFESVQAGWDGYLHLYEVCFDPLDQLTGLLAGDDDGPGGVGTSQILDTPLVTGTEYYLITSGFGAGDFGDFTNSITGPGVVTCGSTPPVDNDTCLDATAVACGDVVVSDTLTNTDTGGNAAPDEWFSFTGTGAAEIVTISLCDGGTDYDSLLRVFSDCTLANEIATNDDACGLQSELSFGSDGTSTYYIMVEGFNTASGNFSLAVTCAAAPVNDNCDGALPISCGEIVAGSTDNASVDSSVAPMCDTSVTAPGVWYVYEDTTGLITDITITMCNGTTDYDSKLSVYTGDCGAPPLNCVVGNDDTCGLQSEVSFQSDGFTTFYILVHGFGGATGNFEIEMTCTPVPPPNDMIANSIDVDEIGFPYTDPSVAMPAATGEAGSPADCNNAGSRGVWYNFTPTGDGTATATISTPGGGLLFTVNNGPLAGSYNAIAAAFGGEFTSTLITEDTAVILDDDTTGDPNDACDPILNGADLSGKIAIARRGACAFTDKVIAAQNAGAIAVIMVNNAPGDPIVMGGTNPDITIPSLMLSDVDGEAIIAELSGASVNVSMGLAPAGFSSVTFYTAPNENAVETDLVLVDWFENQCLPGSTASIPTVAGQAYYVYVVNHPAITDIVIDGTNLGTVDNTIEGFVYYPNPAESTLNLRAQDNIERVALYNILGQKVIDQKVDATTSQLNVSELATGAYIMKVSVNGQLGTYKILKK